MAEVNKERKVGKLDLSKFQNTLFNADNSHVPKFGKKVPFLSSENNADTHKDEQRQPLSKSFSSATEHKQSFGSINSDNLNSKVENKGPTESFSNSLNHNQPQNEGFSSKLAHFNEPVSQSPKEVKPSNSSSFSKPSLPQSPTDSVVRTSEPENENSPKPNITQEPKFKDEHEGYADEAYSLFGNWIPKTPEDKIPPPSSPVPIESKDNSVNSINSQKPINSLGIAGSNDLENTDQVSTRNQDIGDSNTPKLRESTSISVEKNSNEDIKKKPKSLNLNYENVITFRPSGCFGCLYGGKQMVLTKFKFVVEKDQVTYEVHHTGEIINEDCCCCFYNTTPKRDESISFRRSDVAFVDKVENVEAKNGIVVLNTQSGCISSCFHMCFRLVGYFLCYFPVKVQEKPAIVPITIHLKQSSKSLIILVPKPMVDSISNALLN